MPKNSEGIITRRVLKCIKGIEKHSFRLERQQEELKKWLEQNGITTENVNKEITSLVEQHNGKPLIKKLQKLGIKFEEEIINEDTPLYKDNGGEDADTN